MTVRCLDEVAGIDELLASDLVADSGRHTVDRGIVTHARVLLKLALQSAQGLNVVRELGHALDAVRERLLQPLDADSAHALGLVTRNPDDLDWNDEVRIAIEERVAMSPDALTGMEANLRFNGQENMFTRIFGRLSAWQNWIFQRPNAVGESGALKVYGSGEKSRFDWNRV